MATLKQCIANTIKAIDEQFEDNLDGAKEELQKFFKKAEKDQLDDAQLYDALEDLVGVVNSMAKLQKRNTMLNTLARTRVYKYLKENHMDAPVRGIDAMILGIQSGKYGSRKSLERQMDSVVRRYYEGFIGEINEDAQVAALFSTSSADMDRMLANALREASKKKPNMKQFDPAVAKLATIMHKYNELARVEANLAGAWIGKLDDWIATQTHDPMVMLRGRKGKPEGISERDDWIAFMRERLDHERTFGDADPDEFLDTVWNNIIDGQHKSAADGSLDAGTISLTGERNIARSMSKERVLHFKSADDWFDYNQQFGKQTIRESFMAHITKMGNDIAMMQMLGPNPRQNLRTVTEMITNELHAKGENHPDIPRLQDGWSANGQFTRAFDIVDGTANGFSMTKANATAAYVGAAYRGVTVMATLGGMVLSMVTDPAIYAQAIKSNSSRGWFSGLTNSFGSLIEAVGKTPAEKKAIAAKLGVFSDAFIQGVGARFGVDRDFSGGMQRAVTGFMKLNLAAWWTDNLKMSAAIMFSSDIGGNITKKVAFNALDKDLKRGLVRQGIGEHEWAVISRMNTLDYNGSPLAAPEGIRDLGDDVFKAYLKAKGTKITKRSIGEARKSIEDTLRSYYVDLSEYAVLTPDAKTNRIMQKHNQRGTFQGEFWRTVGILKSFGIAIMQKSLGQELFGRGYNYDPSVGVMRNTMRAMQEGNGEFRNVMSLMAGLTVMGYGAMYLKDTAKGKEPASLEDPKTFMRAALQGGGLGILGDFFVGEMMNNRYGGSPIATLAGPAGRTVEDVISLSQGIMELVSTGETDKIAKESWDLVLHHTPYQNHFLLRPIADWAILYSIQEAMNPGYLRRLEGYSEKYTGQKYYAPPAEGGVIGAVTGRESLLGN